MVWPCETRTSTCRSFATISSGLYRFLAIAVLLDVKDIPQVGPLQWGRISNPPIVRSHLDNSDGASVVIIRSPIEVGFNSENSVTDLPVVPDLASPDEYAVVVSVAEVAQEKGVGHVTVSPVSANVATKIKSGPTERRRRIDRRRRRIRSRPRSHISGIRGHRRC